jgi:hypothetical protein
MMPVAGALTGVLAVGLAWSAAAEEPIAARVVEYGIYRADLELSDEKTEDGGQWATASNICHIATTQVIPARPDMQFGFRFRVDGRERGTVIELQQTLEIPPPASPSREPNPIYTTTTINAAVGPLNYAAFVFRDAWLDRLGVWKFRISAGLQLLVEQEFHVVEDTGQKIKASRVATCFLVSSREGERPWTSI